MKIVLHIFGILFLFAAILVGPDVWEAMHAPAKPVTVTPDQEKPVLEEARKPDLPNMPPQPAPPPPEPVVPQQRGGSGIEGVRGGGGGDTIIVGGRSIGDNLVPGSFHGGSGNDTLATDGAGWASFDGQHLHSFEIFQLRNDQPNILYILASGLETTDHGTLVVDGDASIDSVWLDPAIKWGDPVTETGYAIYEGKDAGGRAYIVNIMQGVKVEIRQK